MSRPPEGPLVFSVTDLNFQLRYFLEAQFPFVGVRGEISNLKRPASGHVYYSLKDAGGALRAVMFRRSAQRVAFRLEDGLKVVAFGKVSLYQARGDAQLVVQRIDPDGLGALQLAFEQLKRALAAEGLFDERHKKALPRFPKRIGVVTSATGAAIRDITSVLSRRWPLAPVLLCPASVQGDAAPGDIARALGALDRSGLCDVIIVGRGGGSLEDLWAFNTEPVVRAIFAARAPVVSAVGHEIDHTLSDAVADRFAVTPTAAAELVVPDARSLRDDLAALKAELRRSLEQKTDMLLERLGDLERRLNLQRPARQIDDLSQALDALSERLKRAGAARIAGERRRLELHWRDLWSASPASRLVEFRHRLTAARSRLRQGIEKEMRERHKLLAIVAEGLGARSPLAVLRRGYSVTMRGGEVVTDAAQAPKGTELLVKVLKGEIPCTVVGHRRAGKRKKPPSAQITFGDWLD